MTRFVSRLNCLLFIMLSFGFSIEATSPYDLSVVGFIHQADGLGRQSLILIDMLKDDLKINLITMPGQINTTDVSSEIQKIVLNEDRTPGLVSILEYPLWRIGSDNYKIVPQESKIKIAYTMLESSKIPVEWVDIMNNYFDAVAVPDPFLIDVYESCGVKIPIFFLPLPIYIDDFLNRPHRERPSIPFVFGCTSSGEFRKNLPTLIKAFAKEFRGNSNVFLKINCRYISESVMEECQQLLKRLHVKDNVLFTLGALSHSDYLDFMDSFDCLVSVSKGEGFSIQPREAMAMGLPCIITNNSAQKTICNSNIVRSVESNILEPIIYPSLGDRQGDVWNCRIEDVRVAMRDVYVNYSSYAEKAKKGPNWVLQYRPENLRLKYLNLIKPTKILLGERNEITDEYFMTNSPKLFKTYCDSFDIVGQHVGGQ